MKTLDGTKYCVLLRGQHDCKSQDYWSKYAIKEWGNNVDSYWTTELNHSTDVLEDVLYVKESVRFAGVL